MLVKTYGSAVQGVDAIPVTIEATTGSGVRMTVLGLPDNAVRESLDRIKTAITHNFYNFPKGGLVINLAPADLRKEGSGYDLGMALATMSTTRQVNADQLGQHMIMGELSLDGTIKKIRGALPMAILALKMGLRGFILPKENAAEAAIVRGLDIIPVEHIRKAVDYLNGKCSIAPMTKDTRKLFSEAQEKMLEDLADVKGQPVARRALEVAAAGGHNLIMVGPPGSGKTMLARRIRGILPPLTLQEALETTKIFSVSEALEPNADLMAQRPFRSPHHTISNVALVGGGSFPRPGEVSLAHNGVLFLDELPEFPRPVLEVMRQPIESRQMFVSRARQTVVFPANFMLVASMNPCPCGHYTNPGRSCICSPKQIRKYMGRISGPLMDRIDIQVDVPPVKFDDLNSKKKGESSAEVRKRVVAARELQQDRFADYPGIYSNSMMPSHMVGEFCNTDSQGAAMLKNAVERLGLSGRAFDRILKVSRTIADLEGSEKIYLKHIAESIGYRNLDRKDYAG